jgi:hypothetical protein
MPSCGTPISFTRTGAGRLFATNRQYDQMAVFPGPMEEAVEQLGVFDFDGAVFRDLWGEGKRQTRFRSYVRYLSDHRPLWAALKCGS